MRIHKVDNKPDPDYPSFEQHRLARRGVLKSLVGGFALILMGGSRWLRAEETRAAGTSVPKKASANTPPLKQPVAIDGDMAAVNPPVCKKPIPLKQPVGLEGDIIMPEPPAKLLGRIAAPVKPQPKPPGTVAPVEQPKKPTKPKEDPPRIKGKIAPVKPPKDPSPPRPRGEMVAPEPPPKPEK